MNLDALKDALRRDEGVKPSPYRDTVGKLTIGVGHNLDAKPISPRAIDVILEDDINDVLNDLTRFIPWWHDLDDVRQLVLANMCFNLGIQSLLGFKNMLGFAKAGQYEDAAKAMGSSKWAYQVGNRATRLIHMMETGEMV